METRVYNRDFIEHNFKQDIQGIFTLGEQEVDTLKNIELTKSEIDNLANDIKIMSNTLHGDDGNGGKTQELKQHEEKYREIFWQSKIKHADKLAGTRTGEGLRGVINSQENFMNKVLIESNTNNADLQVLDELETKANRIFSDTPPVEMQTLSNIHPEKLLSLEQAPILEKRIIGKDDVDIAAMYKKLDNSGWVRQGISYYEANDSICPFCQQKTFDGFAKSLREYFDETFEKDNEAINVLILEYKTECNRIQQYVQTLIDSYSIHIDNRELENEKKMLDSVVTGNLHIFEQKKKDISQVVKINSLKNILDKIVMIIATANDKIKSHNTIVRNLTNEKKILTTQIWRFIIEELKIHIANYKNEKENLINAINNLRTKIQSKNDEKRTKETELSALEKQTSSIQPTRDGINKLLASFGFKNFSLGNGSDGRTYKLVRANGSDAQDTISEGERNFVTFLYFYYLLNGSQSESGVTVDKIVVFDDPVSSLDNNILFIVSSLIRELFDGVRKNDGTIKQIFVLTHNIYFHKEVTFDPDRNKDSLRNYESFWLVKKYDTESILEKQTLNPVKTSYQMLWDEVRSPNKNNVTIQNTLRRILENYFKLLGRIPLDILYTKFDGDKKIICKSLCSWIHDGSHSAFDDDYYTPLDDTNVHLFLDMFKQIFEQCGQIAHYNMMMGLEPTSDKVSEESNNSHHDTKTKEQIP
jgi:wobble nucleotide-excising tRNase